MAVMSFAVQLGEAVPAAVFTIPGVVRVKKNSLRRIKRGDRVLSVSSAAHAAWEHEAVLRLRLQNHHQPNVTTWGPLNLRALIYLDRDSGDLDNLLGSVCDALQAAKIITNDHQIGGFDGSRRLIDKVMPRVEIILTPLEG